MKYGQSQSEANATTLDPTKKKLKKKFHYLMSLPEEVEEPEVKERVVVLLDKFLQWTKKNRGIPPPERVTPLHHKRIRHDPRLAPEEVNLVARGLPP